MCKLLITDEQYKAIITKIIKEEMCNEQTQIFNLRDLAKMMVHQFHDDDKEELYGYFLKALSSKYRHHGDDAVIDFFAKGAGFTLTPMGHARYIVE